MQLVTLPDERLFGASREVKNIDGRIAQIATDMLEVMRASKGVGLAGIQVGLAERIFVVHIDDDLPRVFINPVIKERSTHLVGYEEGCLSVPGVYASVQRPDVVLIEAYDLSGRGFEMEADDFLARVIQHEYDHLEGVLFYQHLPERKRDRFLQGYQKLHDIVL
jgi:peptide deformylase